MEGYSTKELAAILGITFKTAACHRTHIMQKLGIRNTLDWCDMHSTRELSRVEDRRG